MSRKRMRKFITYLSIIFVLLTSGCRNQNAKENNEQGYFHNKIKYASHITIEESDDFSKLIVIDPWQKTSGTRFEYYLIRNKDNKPDVEDSSMVIYVPVKKIVLMSTTYIPMISALGVAESIKGVSGTNFIYDNEIRKMVSNGLIQDVGYEENLDKERIINIAPDLVITYGVGGETASYSSKLREFGIKVLFNADYLEETPLGRAEWIKMFGALFCLQDKADSIFNNIESEYNKLKLYIDNKIDSRPEVMLGLPWQNVWYISPGNSYLSNLIDDAGGYYIWKGLTANYAVPMGIENVFVKAEHAEYWLNTGDASSLSQIFAIDRRFAFLPPVIKRNVYNNNKRISPGGGNDYWESGTIKPYIILKDIASIIHHELFEGYELFYYKKLE
ncbi:MAG: ABC transporter substrate-binding protein [Bacteroidales bacterium]|nr:ABC transporter substrate-binding protein [Bacteroidales bacterium]